MELSAEKKELFENMPVNKAILKMAIPTVLASIVSLLYSMTDTFFVGMLNDPIETSGVTLASSIILSFNAVNNLFGIGSSSLMSRAMGKGDFVTAKRASAFGVYGSSIFGILYSLGLILFNTSIITLLGADSDTFGVTKEYIFWIAICGALPSILHIVLSYLVKAEGAAMHSSIGVMAGCILNMILDPFFILPGFLGMGAAGAGLATFISNTVSTLYFAIYLVAKRNSTFISVSFDDFIKAFNISKEIFIVGIPACIQNLLNVVGLMMLNKLSAGYGTITVAAMGIVYRISQIPIQFAWGITNGVSPLISYNYTAGSHKRMKDIFYQTLKIEIYIAAVLVFISFTFSKGIMTLFIKDAAVIDLGKDLLKIMGIAPLFMTVDFTGVNFFVALGKGRYSFICAIVRKLILEIPVMYIAGKVLGVYGLAAGFPVAEFVMAFISTYLVRKILTDIGIK